MYLKLVLATCFLACCSVVFSAYVRLSDAGLGCARWPACYEENALKERQPKDASARDHTSWKWKLQNMVGLALGILTIAVCVLSWQKQKELRQSPLLPTLLLGLMVFLALFGIFAFSHLPRSVIVPIHLLGGSATIALPLWIAQQQMTPAETASSGEIPVRRSFFWLGLALVLIQITLGGWVSSNFAALACTGFPFCNGSLLPPMDFSYSLDRYGPPLATEQLTAIHLLHRFSALLTLVYMGWLSVKIMAAKRLRAMGVILLGLTVLQLALGVSNALLGLTLAGATLHNAVAMLLLVALTRLNFMAQGCAQC